MPLPAPCERPAGPCARCLNRSPPVSGSSPCGTGIAERTNVLISRCAWHRRYYGYTTIVGVSSWRGLKPSFTDGICHKCAVRVRADHLRARFDPGASAHHREKPWMPGLAVLVLAIVVALVLIARPTHEMPSVAPVVSVLPPPAVDEPVVAEPSSVSAPRSPVLVPRSPRVARRPVFGQPVRLTWSSPSALPRSAIPVAWGYSPYRSPVLRES